MPLISFSNISKLFKGKYVSTNALKNINLEIYEGEFVAILGPSGSGKSTFLNIIAGIEKADTGVLLYKGVDIETLSSSKLALYRQKIVGIIFQRSNLFKKASVLFNIKIPRFFSSSHDISIDFDALSLLLDLNIKEKSKQKSGNLSVGEQQKIAVARAVINEPDIILADEPTGSLDTENGLIIVRMLEKLNIEKKKTIILVTHNPDIINAAHKIVHLRDGEIESIQEGKVFESSSKSQKSIDVKQKPGQLTVKKAITLIWHLASADMLKLLSTLVIIAIAIGVIVSILSTLPAFHEYWEQDIPAVHPANQLLVSTVGESEIFYGFQNAQYEDISQGRVITPDFVQAVNAMPSVSFAYPVYGFDVNFFSKTVNSEAQTDMPSNDWTKNVDALSYGSYFKSNTENAIILTTHVAQSLAGGNSIGSIIGKSYPVSISLSGYGSNILHENINLTVVGILKQDGLYSYPLVSNDILGVQEKVPVIHALKIYTIHTNDISNVQKYIQSQGFFSISSSDFSSVIYSYLTVAHLLIGIIIALALISALTGILYIMHITFMTRSRELGIFVSIGALKSSIFYYIIAEVFCITATASFFGIILGYILSFLIQLAINSLMVSTNFEVVSVEFFHVIPSIVLESFLFSILIGIVVSLYPVIRALSSKRLIDALKME